MTSIPVSWKSLALRVAKAARWARQIEAICTSKPSIGRPARSRPLTIVVYATAASASKASTRSTKSANTSSAVDRSSSLRRPSASCSMP